MGFPPTLSKPPSGIVVAAVLSNGTLLPELEHERGLVQAAAESTARPESTFETPKGGGVIFSFDGIGHPRG